MDFDLEEVWRVLCIQRRATCRSFPCIESEILTPAPRGASFKDRTAHLRSAIFLFPSHSVDASCIERNGMSGSCGKGSNSLHSSQASEQPAFILGALTGVGGIIGYARTGSVPSIAAGLTVGILVWSPGLLAHLAI